MQVPAYVRELMSRARYTYSIGDPGYTVRIRKRTQRAYAVTLTREVTRLCAWANRQCPETCYILRVPTATHYRDQYATVTIYDPVMQHIEQYIPKGE